MNISLLMDPPKYIAQIYTYKFARYAIKIAFILRKTQMHCY